MMSHSKTTQFNWECVVPLTPASVTTEDVSAGHNEITKYF